ncbi:MAG TPA: hypothetical protein VFG54_09420 [Prolixibacteraceae bacterium]|nr:hypothetical protein [Prolixibacteraceae bacterium]
MLILSVQLKETGNWLLARALLPAARSQQLAAIPSLLINGIV